MELGDDVVEQVVRAGLECGEIIPEAMAGELVFEEAKHAFNEIQFGRVRRKQNHRHAVLVGTEPPLHGRAFVLGGIVHDNVEVLFGVGGAQEFHELLELHT